MLSYRHAFHAGNHADVLKHFILYLVLDYFNRKDKPYWYLDTHSGAGLYNLEDGSAQKVGEYRYGIDRLTEKQPENADLAAFVRHLAQKLPPLPPRLYGGSPWLAQSLLREGDKLRLFELHPADFALLQANTARDRRVIAKQADGFHELPALLPPPPRRAVVLIDPPYEVKQDYGRTAATLKDALKRFATGCYMVWYPCLGREESRRLPEKLRKLSPQNHLCAELHVCRPRADGFGMHGSGMFLINPPYTLAMQLERALPELTRLLAQDDGATFALSGHAR